MKDTFVGLPRNPLNFGQVCAGPDSYSGRDFFDPDTNAEKSTGAWQPNKKETAWKRKINESSWKKKFVVVVVVVVGVTGGVVVVVVVADGDVIVVGQIMKKNSARNLFRKKF